MSFYDILGVTKSATSEEIKKAYRDLSRIYHPDRPTGDEEKFKELVEAYEVLSDENKRASYDVEMDNSGRIRPSDAPGENFDVFANVFKTRDDKGSTPVRGLNYSTSIVISMAESVYGTTKTANYTAKSICGACSGKGIITVETDTCPTCNGTRKVKLVTENPFGHKAETVRACPDCRTKPKTDVPCEECLGKGEIIKKLSAEVVIHPGIKDGEKVRVNGHGAQGKNGGGPGDLIVTVNVDNTGDYVINGANVEVTVQLSLTEFITGTTKQVEIPQGTSNIKIPQGSKPNSSITIAGKGMHYATSVLPGNLIVHLELKLPEVVSLETVEALKELGF